jgi:dihydroorotate dehydrogenase (fumarate)
MDAWREELRLLAQEADSAGKPLVANVAGESVDEYLELAEQAFALGVNTVEFNLAWPNLASADGKQKYTFSDHPNSVAELLRQAKTRFAPAKSNLWLKFSPLQPTLLEEMVLAIKEHGIALVTGVVCCSPFPRTLVFDDEGESVVGDHSFGRMGGDFLRPIALGQVKQFRRLLPADIALIGVGGVSTRAHVDEYLAAGASAVGLTTAYLIAGADVFSYLLEEPNKECG